MDNNVSIVTLVNEMCRYLERIEGRVVKLDHRREMYTAMTRDEVVDEIARLKDLCILLNR